jgi:intracellular sulfur oxidation DsrE/DsrF family protein
VEALLRVEAYYEQQGFTESHPPVTFVIFGPPVAIFFKTNYSDNKQIVDLAARLTALQVIDVRVCEFSYQATGLDSKNLLPFVSTVPFGPDEVTRLVEEERYNYF